MSDKARRCLVMWDPLNCCVDRMRKWQAAFVTCLTAYQGLVVALLSCISYMRYFSVLLIVSVLGLVERLCYSSSQGNHALDVLCHQVLQKFYSTFLSVWEQSIFVLVRISSSCFSHAYKTLIVHWFLWLTAPDTYVSLPAKEASLLIFNGACYSWILFNRQNGTDGTVSLYWIFLEGYNSKLIYKTTWVQEEFKESQRFNFPFEQTGAELGINS